MHAGRLGNTEYFLVYNEPAVFGGVMQSNIIRRGCCTGDFGKNFCSDFCGIDGVISFPGPSAAKYERPPKGRKEGKF